MIAAFDFIFAPIRYCLFWIPSSCYAFLLAALSVFGFIFILNFVAKIIKIFK